MNNRSLRLLSSVVLSSIIITCCVKDRGTSSLSQSQKEIENAKDYFENNVANRPSNSKINNYRALISRSIRWEAAKIVELSIGNATIVPIDYKNIYVTSDLPDGSVFALSDMAKLVIFHDSSGEFQSRVVTLIPDSSASVGAGQLSGTVFNEDWQGNSVTKAWHFQGKVAEHSSVSDEGNETKQVDQIQQIQVCNTIYGYNYAADAPDDVESWSETSCTTYGFESGAPAGGLGRVDIGGIYGSGRIPIYSIQIPPPTSPIANFSDYSKCFTPGDGGGHSFTVMLAVEQPDPGTREPWTLSETGLGGSSAGVNPVNVGHTFLIFSENTGSNIITRNVGFYPQTIVLPGSPSSQGVLDNDQNTPYNISLTVTVTSGQFYSMLDYINQGNGAGYMYNLNSNNCTTFALDAMDAGGVSIPSTLGTWAFGGQGLDPGDLGEDIRGMQLPTNMTKSTVGNAHANAGTCN